MLSWKLGRNCENSSSVVVAAAVMVLSLVHFCIYEATSSSVIDGPMWALEAVGYRACSVSRPEVVRGNHTWLYFILCCSGFCVLGERLLLLC